MTVCDFTVELFCRVDDALPALNKHPLVSLAPSEVVTLGLLHVLRGEGQRAFYRWVQKELKGLFPHLPERTRLFRLLQQHAGATQHFLAAPTLFCVCHSYGIELLHPRGQGRSPRQIGRKGKSNTRWIVGAKCFVLCNDTGQIVAWKCAGANGHDTMFYPLLVPLQDKVCAKGA